MGLILEVIKALSEEKDNKKKHNLEAEMDRYGLEEVEREFVRRGDYEPYNFEDSEDEKLDEDDYYYEDK